MKRFCCFFLLLTCFAVSAGREVIPPDAKVVFYGDSITASGFYPHYLQTYCLTRFPEQKNTWIFSGTSGSNLTNSLLRLDREVIGNQPDVVFIMMGMNDVNISLYDKAPPAERNAAQRKAALDAFASSLKETCRKIGPEARIVLLTPTPYDQYSRKSGRNLPSANEGLARVAELVRKFAGENKLQLVDLHAPYTELLKRYPDCGINRTDRIHPEILGHLCMMKLLAERLDLPAAVARIELDYQNGGVLKQENAVVTRAEKAGAVLRWNYAPKALPFPVTAETPAADRLFGFTNRVNREEVVVKNLPAGRYDLLAGGRPVGVFSAGELSKGVNIATLDTPSQRLAQRVFLKICEGKGIIGDERTVRAVEFFSQVNGKVDPADFQAMKAYNDAVVARQPANSYGRHQYGVYKRFQGRDGELRENAQKCFRAAAALAVPAAFDMELRPAQAMPSPSAGFQNGVSTGLINQGAVPQVERAGRKAFRFDSDSKKYLSASLQGTRVVSGVIEFRIEPGTFMPRQNLLEKRSPKNEWHLFLSPAGSRMRPSFIVWNEKGAIRNNVPINTLLEYGRDYRMDFEIEKSGRVRLRLDGAAILDIDLKEPLNLERSPVRVGGVMRGEVYSVNLYADHLPPQENTSEKSVPAASRADRPRPVAEFQNGTAVNLTNHGAVPVEEKEGRKSFRFDNDGKRYLSALLQGGAVVSGEIEFRIAPGAAMPRQNLLEKRSPKNEWHLFLSPVGNRLRPSLIVWNEKGEIRNNVPVKALLEYGHRYRMDFEIEKSGRVRLRLDGTVILDTDVKEPLNLGRSPVRIGGVMRGEVYSVGLYADSALPR